MVELELRLRRAGLEDLDLSAVMNKQLIEDEGSANPMSYEQLKTRMREWLTSDWQIEYIIGDANVVGYALYQFRNNPYEEKRKEVYIRQLFIRREYRGEGYGMRGIALLKAERFRGIRTIEVDVLEANERGKSFWARAGFHRHVVNMRLEQAED